MRTCSLGHLCVCLAHVGRREGCTTRSVEIVHGARSGRVYGQDRSARGPPPRAALGVRAWARRKEATRSIFVERAYCPPVPPALPVLFCVRSRPVFHLCMPLRCPLAGGGLPSVLDHLRRRAPRLSRAYRCAPSFPLPSNAARAPFLNSADHGVPGRVHHAALPLSFSLLPFSRSLSLHPSFPASLPSFHVPLSLSFHVFFSGKRFPRPARDSSTTTHPCAHARPVRLAMSALTLSWAARALPPANAVLWPSAGVCLLTEHEVQMVSLGRAGPK